MQYESFLELSKEDWVTLSTARIFRALTIAISNWNPHQP
jgi:hypothetical protein